MSTRHSHSRLVSANIRNDPVRCSKIVSLRRVHGIDKKDLADRFNVSLETIVVILKKEGCS